MVKVTEVYSSHRAALTQCRSTDSQGVRGLATGRLASTVVPEPPYVIGLLYLCLALWHSKSKSFSSLTKSDA